MAALRQRPLLLLVLALHVALFLGPSARAQSTAWSQPIVISVDDLPANGKTAYKLASSWFPDIAAGPNGVSVVWYSGVANGPDPSDDTDLLMYRELRNDVWSPANAIVLAAEGGYTVRNSIAVAPNGKLHVLFRSTVQVKHISAPWEKAWSARVWDTPQPVNAGASYYNALATDSKGTLHAFWSEGVADEPAKPNTICPGCADLFYRRSIDDGTTWSQPLDLSRTMEGENRPQVKIDQRNHVHVVWDEGADWYASKGSPKSGVYRRSDDEGNTWSSPVHFGLPNAAIQQTTLAVTADGNPFVVYRSVADNRLFFQQSVDGGNTWGTPAEIPGVRARDINDGNLDTYSMATDSAGHVHLLMVGFDPVKAGEQRSPWLLHLIWNGAQWSLPDVVMKGDLYPEWPRLVIANGNQAHVVWYTRGSYEGIFRSDKGAHYQVWYSTQSLDAPSVATAPFFTPVPNQVSVTPTILSPPTPIPTLPAAVSSAPPLTDKPAWESDGITSIVLALAPVLGLLGLCGLLYWYTRRS